MKLLIIVFMLVYGVAWGCDYCIEHPGEKELHYSKWKTCKLCGCEYAKGEREIHLSGSAHNPPLDAYPKIFYAYPPEKLIEKCREDKNEKDKFLKWRRLYEEYIWFGSD